MPLSVFKATLVVIFGNHFIVRIGSRDPFTLGHETRSLADGDGRHGLGGMDLRGGYANGSFNGNGSTVFIASVFVGSVFIGSMFIGSVFIGSVLRHDGVQV